MEAPGHYQRELLLVGGSTLDGHARYRLHWTGEPMPGLPNYKFASPIDCWALIWWVDTDSEHPGGAGGYAVLQAFWKQEDGQYLPTMLETQGLNLRVLTMMAAEAERHRHDFAALRHRLLLRQRARAGEAISGKIADILQDAAPQFTGPTSFSGKDALPTVVEKTVEQMERNLGKTDEWARRMGRGPVVREAGNKEAEAHG